MSHRWRGSIALFAATSTWAGCMLLSPGAALKGEPWAASYDEPRTAAPCVGAPADPIQEEVQGLMCGGGSTRAEIFLGDPDQEPLAAAVSVVDCAAYACEPPQQDNARLAAAADLAQRIDSGKVQAALGASELKAQLRDDFLQRYTAAHDRVLALVAENGARWHAVFLQPALDARSARKEQDRALAAWTARVDQLGVEADRALVGGAVKPTTIEAALALRRDYVEACRPVRKDLRVCLADGVGRRLNAMIQHLAERGQDEPLARAEQALLRLPDRTDPRSDEYAALEAAYDAEAAQYQAWETAKQSVGSEAVLAQRWPQPPIDVANEHIYVAPRPANPDADGSIRSDGTPRSDLVDEQVRAVNRKGDRATVVFRKNVHVGTVETDCRRTNRISSINRDGQVIYETECAGSKRYTEDRTEKPIELPWLEAAALRPDERIEAVVDHDTRRGHLTFAADKPAKGEGQGASDNSMFQRDRQLQLREFRVDASKAP